MLRRTLQFALCYTLAWSGGVNAAGVANPEALAAGQRHYDLHCSSCHNGSAPEAPQIAALSKYSARTIVDSLETGVMSTIGMVLSAREKQELAYFLTREQVTQPALDLAAASCKTTEPVAFGPVRWNGWGDAGNRRFQESEAALNKKTVKQLKLKWAFAMPEATRARSQPLVTSTHLFVGSQSGAVYALDRATGCVHWQFRADSEVRGALTAHTNAKGIPTVLLFGDFKANVYALDAQTGALLWRAAVHDHPLATITGTVTTDGDRVYVPVSSSEVVPAAQPNYPCCTFRGAIVALNLTDGTPLWKTYTTPAPRPTGKTTAGTASFGPSGAPVWSGPTVDVKRGRLYVTTGQNYSSPATGTSDAVLALRLSDGKIDWVTQATANDAWNGGCSRGTINCPEENGPDFDIGTSVVIASTPKANDILLFGQKSGEVFALNPDQKGEVLWRTRVGKGGIMGGVHWGISSDGKQVYVGISDAGNSPHAVGPAFPGIHALDIASGDIVWRNLLPDVCPKGIPFNCFHGISAAVSNSPGLVFAGGLDGMLRVFDAANGDTLWETNTARSFTTVNGIAGNGGAIEADGPVIADGQVIVTSGYDKWGEMPGNVLLVYSVDGQ